MNDNPSSPTGTFGTAAFRDAALQYAGRGWPVFPLSRSKVPFRGTHGHLDASTDPAAVEALWVAHPGANVGLATGHLVVFDADGAEGLATFLGLGRGPRTLVARTPRGGWHFYYGAPEGVELRCHNQKRPAGVKNAPGLDIKAHGGYVLLPPSRDRHGGAYSWQNQWPIADLPDYLRVYAQTVGAAREKSAVQLVLPAHLTGRPTRDLLANALGGIRTPWSAHEEARLWAALKTLVKDVGYDDFLRIGFALHHLGWERSDGTDIGFDLWDQWAELFPESHNLAGLEAKWRSFGRDYPGRRCTIGTVLAMAQERGWDGAVELVPLGSKKDSETVLKSDAVDLKVNGVHALPAGLTATLSDGGIVFPDTDKAGRPRNTCTNTRLAVEALGVACRQDVFHDRLEIGGQVIERWQGEVSDTVVQMVRPLIYERFGFDPGMVNANDAVLQLCYLNRFHPIQDYLAGLCWDGRPRLATWLADYLGAEPSRLNAEFGQLALVAAVRRIRAPGAKFDEITVLEGPEGANKSTAIQILAGEGNFSDQPILTLDDRAQQEALRGVWLYEIADLTGISRTDVDRIKAFASRRVDRTRPAYGRHRVDAPRTCVFFGTTNNDRYLQSQTGNRRFWPVRVGNIDLAKLESDRDQLWAEAVSVERRGVSVRLGAAHWGEAAAVQDQRLELDPWEDIIAHIRPSASNTFLAADGRGEEMRLLSSDIFELILRIGNDRINMVHAKRLSFIMRRHGWDGPKFIWQGDRSARGYSKKI